MMKTTIDPRAQGLLGSAIEDASSRVLKDFAKQISRRYSPQDLADISTTSDYLVQLSSISFTTKRPTFVPNKRLDERAFAEISTSLPKVAESRGEIELVKKSAALLSQLHQSQAIESLRMIGFTPISDNKTEDRTRQTSSLFVKLKGLFQRFGARLSL